MQGHGNNFPMPGGEYLDASNFNHYNQFKAIDHTALSTKLPVSLPIVGDRVGLPRGLAPGGPAMTAAQLVFNKDLFTGKDIVERDADDREIKAKRWDFAYRNLSPGIGRNAVALYDAILGDGGATKASTPEQIVRYATGFKFRHPDIPDALHWNSVTEKRNEREYDSAIRSAMRKGDKQEVARLHKAKAEMKASALDRQERMMKGIDKGEPIDEELMNEILEFLREKKRQGR
jgi:hypothetical protein